MFIEKVTFSIGRTMPLFPISKRKEDEYANIKPHVSITVAFDPNEAKIDKRISNDVKQLVKELFADAADLALQELAEFGQEFRQLYKKAGDSGPSET